MTSEYDGFIRAICENPQDHLVRLVFADWLQDNEQEDRGAFIRESIRKNRNPSEGDYGDLQSVLERHWKSWVPECGNGRIGFELRRGFVSEVRLPLADFLERAGELFETHPITSVVLTDRRPMVFYLWFDAGTEADRSADDRQWLPSIRENRHWLPSCIFGRLPGGGLLGHSPKHREYDSAAEAVAALSDACVAHARASANLPPLPLATTPMKEPDAQT